MTKNIGADMHLSPEALRALWDFSDPVASESRFREELRGCAPDSAIAAELATQMARALGLQQRFDEADALLDTVIHPSPVVQARRSLERGRLRNSSGEPQAAIPEFTCALEYAKTAGNEVLIGDAIHMLGIADPTNAATWIALAIDLLGTSDEPRARRWIATMFNNDGWTLHDGEHYDAALVRFEQARNAFTENGSAEDVRIADWSIARCLRSLGRYQEALSIQERIQPLAPDTYVDEEITILRDLLASRA